MSNASFDSSFEDDKAVIGKITFGISKLKVNMIKCLTKDFYRHNDRSKPAEHFGFLNLEMRAE
jgi:hypothetical protein